MPSIVGNNWKHRPKIKSQTKPTHPIPIPHQGPHFNNLGPPGAPSDPPNNNTYPQNDPFFLTTSIVGNNWKHRRPKIQSQTTHPPHPHSSPGTPYQHSGTTGGPIRPPKQQHIPPKRSIFPEHPLLWVTTGSIGLKSKIKPPTPSPSLMRDPISKLWDQGGPHQTPQTTMHTPKTIHFS